MLLDDGMSCEAVAKVLLLDDDTIRAWYRLYEEDGIEGLTNFSYEGSACQLSGEQQEKLKTWVAAALPRTTRQVGAWIENEFGVVYEGRSGLIALLHRQGLEYHKPNVIPRKLDEEKQKAFIEGYEKLLNSLGDDEAVLFADAVHPTHAVRPAGCWAPKQEKLAIEQTSGRQRINIHGAIDLQTGQTRMIEALTIDAASTIRLLQSIEALYPMLALIHVFLDNARYHHAKLVQEWLAQPGRRIKLHFIPTYCPHLNPIERLWGLMHRNVTHNKCYATCAQFADATLSFLREKVPGNWADLCDSVTDNFRVINPKDFRVIDFYCCGRCFRHVSFTVVSLNSLRFRCGVLTENGWQSLGPIGDARALGRSFHRIGVHATSRMPARSHWPISRRTSDRQSVAASREWISMPPRKLIILIMSLAGGAIGLLTPVGVVKWVLQTEPEDAGILTLFFLPVWFLLVVFGLLVGRRLGWLATGGRRIPQR